MNWRTLAEQLFEPEGGWFDPSSVRVWPRDAGFFSKKGPWVHDLEKHAFCREVSSEHCLYVGGDYAFNYKGGKRLWWFHNTPTFTAAVAVVRDWVGDVLDWFARGRYSWGVQPKQYVLGVDWSRRGRR